MKHWIPSMGIAACIALCFCVGCREPSAVGPAPRMQGVWEDDLDRIHQEAETKRDCLRCHSGDRPGGPPPISFEETKEKGN